MRISSFWSDKLNSAARRGLCHLSHKSRRCAHAAFRNRSLARTVRGLSHVLKVAIKNVFHAERKAPRLHKPRLIPPRGKRG